MVERRIKMEKPSLIEIAFVIMAITFLIMVIEGIKMGKKQQEINYDIELKKIEQGTYERKEVNIKNEGDEESNKPIQIMEIQS